MNISFSGFLKESDDQNVITEAFNTAPYDLTFGKKSAGDIFFTFHDEDDKEFRIQFYTPSGIGKNVRQVYIGQKKGASYLDSTQQFKNPMKVVASMIEATKQFLETPIGKGIDGFAINFSKKAMDRGIKLLPKIIRQSGLKQKLNVMDLNYAPDEGRGYVWVVRKGKDPAQVFNGPKMKGVTWDDPDKVGDAPVQPPVDSSIGDSGTTVTIRGRGSYTEVGVDRMGLSVKFLENNTNEILSFSDESVARFVNDNSDVRASVSLRQSPGSYIGCSVVVMKKLGMSKGQEFVINDSEGRRVADITLMTVNTGNAQTAKSSLIDLSSQIKVAQYSAVKMKSEKGVVVLSYTFPNYGTEVDGWTIEKRADYNPQSKQVQFETRVMDNRGIRKSNFNFELPYEEGRLQKFYENWNEYITSVITQLSQINNGDYNKYSLKIGVVSIDKDGIVRLDGTDLGASRNRSVVIDRLARMTTDEETARRRAASERPAKVDSKKIISDLNKMASQGREIDWQIREYQGKIYADWDITFRRNSRTGAFMDNKSDINAANSALKRMQAYLENLGYKTEVFILGIDDVRVQDATSDSAYSEYEQSIGSSLKAYK